MQITFVQTSKTLLTFDFQMYDVILWKYVKYSILSLVLSIEESSTKLMLINWAG